jgi:NAD(P)-dependent dehydrogenase (short-subunit alcohol dehydrogenase family)
MPVVLDVLDQETVRQAAEWVNQNVGHLDALVNNAAIDYDTDQSVLSADLDRVRSAIETNTLGPWRVAQAFLPLLRKSEHARIVNVSSSAGEWRRMTGRTPAYSISKLALNGLTRMMASVLESDGILVNAVGPGWVRTDMGGSNANRSTSEGAASVVWAVTLPDDGPTGGFFRDGEPIDW